MNKNCEAFGYGGQVESGLSYVHSQWNSCMRQLVTWAGNLWQVESDMSYVAGGWNS